MFVGTLVAIIHGVGWPILAYIFGGMTNEFIKASDPLDLQNSSRTNIGNVSAYFNESVTNASSYSDLQQVMATYSLYYTALGFVVFIASTLQIYCWQLACERQVHRMRKDFFYQVLRQEIGWFDQNESGGFSSKLNE